MMSMRSLSGLTAVSGGVVLSAAAFLGTYAYFKETKNPTNDTQPHRIQATYDLVRLNVDGKPQPLVEGEKPLVKTFQGAGDWKVVTGEDGLPKVEFESEARSRDKLFSTNMAMLVSLMGGLLGIFVGGMAGTYLDNYMDDKRTKSLSINSPS